MNGFAAARRQGPSYGTVIAVAILVGIVLLLFATGRLEARKWQPFLEPSTWRFLGEGLLATLIVAGVSLVLSVLFGIVLGALRAGLHGPLGWLVSGTIELVRATPILAILLIVTLVMLRLRLTSEAVIAGILGLTVYNSAVIAEIVRAGISSIPRGEVEAARSLGLSHLQTMRSVVLPPALSRMTPALVSQVITLNKDTSLLFIIAAPELLSYGRSFYNFYGNLLETYFVIAVIFFLINYPLSRFSRRLEARQPIEERLHVVGEEDQTLIPVMPPRGTTA